MESDEQSTVNEIEVAYDAMQKTLERQTADSTLIHTIKLTISTELLKYYTLNEYSAAAALLDPLLRYAPNFLTQEKKEQGKSLIHKLLNELPEPLTGNQTVQQATPVSSSHRARLFMAGQTASSSSSQGENEYNRYLAFDLRHVSVEEKPLEFWCTNKYSFPKLSAIAQFILTCPATSVACERLFSRASFVIGKRGVRITMTTFLSD